MKWYNDPTRRDFERIGLLVDSGATGWILKGLFKILVYNSLFNSFPLV
ncbi:hypothetical protein ACFX5U_15185 [Sphingobacterium sp. SG20118]